MLFNSAEFIFLFLPIVLGGYYLFRARFENGNIPMLFLVLASLFFYGWWNPIYLLVILGSIAVNYQIGRRIIVMRESAPVKTKTLLTFGIAANLSILAYFKYSIFLMDSVGSLVGTDFHLTKIVLPLAISFFTFQQIAYLVDAYRAECDDYDFIHYCLFVTFFPQLIAGPIVHHSEMMPQFMRRTRTDLQEDFYIGISFFVFGLAKKVLIADNIAQWSTPVFGAADAGQDIGTLEAWGGALAYSLQLYFDFSGYADMAIGAARMFGIRLPLNFNSPYQSKSIIDFWRTWHMTLSRFLRDYLYIPLGGSRHGTYKRYRNLMITMLLGGLWHGAGWNFVIWGGLHGSYLVVNHTFRQYKPALPKVPSFIGVGASWALTLLCVVIAWVFFRAETFDGAMLVFQSMFVYSDTVATDIWELRDDKGWRLIALYSLIALFLPNTSRCMAYFHQDEQDKKLQPLWKPGIITAVVMIVVFVASVKKLSEISEFLYFQF